MKRKKQLFLITHLLLPTFDELAAERVEGGANPSNTDTAAPTSGSTIGSAFM